MSYETIRLVVPTSNPTVSDCACCSPNPGPQTHRIIELDIQYVLLEEEDPIKTAGETEVLCKNLPKMTKSEVFVGARLVKVLTDIRGLLYE